MMKLAVEALSRLQKDKVMPLWCDFLCQNRHRKHPWGVEMRLLDELDDFSDANRSPENVHLTLEDIADFVEIGRFQVLLPLPRKHHGRYRFELLGLNRDETLLSVLAMPSQAWEVEAQEQACGFVAICMRPAGEPFFVTRLFHETLFEGAEPFEVNSAAAS